MTGCAEAPDLIALGVIDAELADYRRWRYALNIEGHARSRHAQLADTLILNAGDDVERRLHAAVESTGAGLVIAPSLRHLHGCERQLTACVELYVVGRARTYSRGHRWT